MRRPRGKLFMKASRLPSERRAIGRVDLIAGGGDARRTRAGSRIAELGVIALVNAPEKRRLVDSPLFTLYASLFTSNVDRLLPVCNIFPWDADRTPSTWYPSL
jgi:hypothetical protein